MIARRIFISIIELYRKYLSGMKIRCCRFYPSCSEYAIDSIKKYGVLVGVPKSLLRVLRCNPFTKGGYDPA